MKKQRIVDILGYANIIGWIGSLFVADPIYTYCSVLYFKLCMGVWFFILVLSCFVRVEVFQKIPKNERRNYDVHLFRGFDISTFILFAFLTRH